MKIASIAFTENGAKIVKMLVHEMDVKGYVFEKYKTDGLETFNNVSSLVRDIFKKYNAIVFVGACGIAVRSNSSVCQGVKPKIRLLWWLMKKAILRYRFCPDI